jgi:hypothetical protein
VVVASVLWWFALKSKRDSSHPQADPFAAAKGEEKIGLLRAE